MGTRRKLWNACLPRDSNTHTALASTRSQTSLHTLPPILGSSFLEFIKCFQPQDPCFFCALCLESTASMGYCRWSSTPEPCTQPLTERVSAGAPPGSPHLSLFRAHIDVQYFLSESIRNSSIFLRVWPVGPYYSQVNQ